VRGTARSRCLGAFGLHDDRIAAACARSCTESPLELALFEISLCLVCIDLFRLLPRRAVEFAAPSSPL